MSGKCVKCGKTTKYAIRYALDCSPIWCHKKCEDDVKEAIILSLSGLKKEVKKLTEGWHWPFE